MARMIPVHGPQPVGSQSRAWLALFDALRTGLPERCLVVHGAGWVTTGRGGGPPADGKADFIVADPERGLLLIDVCEGGVQYDPSGRRWVRLGGVTGSAPITDPFSNAQANHDALMIRLGSHPTATPSLPVHGWAVAMPGIVAPPRGLAAHAPAELILDRDALSQPAKAIAALFDTWTRRGSAAGNASPRWWWRAVEDLFVAPREARVLLRHRIADDRSEMVALTDDQVRLLEMLGRIRRQTIYGPAGTGKTVLAITKARMLAREGMKVLLTCYNKALGHHLRDTLADEPGIRAAHFHELCWQVARLDEREVETPSQSAARARFFDVDLPQLLVERLADEPLSFDALVVDEGQDFLPGWWPVLDRLCGDQSDAIRYTFYDDGQRLRADAAEVPGREGALVLRTNWRNTRSIHRHLAEIEPRAAEADCAAPDGVPVAFEPLKPSRRHALRRVLTNLIDAGGVAPADIVILTGRSAARSQTMQVEQPVGRHILTAEDEPGRVRVRGVQAFKGMEAPVVVLTELNHYTAEKAQRLYYVGASRAMNHLVVLDDARPLNPRR